MTVNPTLDQRMQELEQLHDAVKNQAAERMLEVQAMVNEALGKLVKLNAHLLDLEQRFQALVVELIPVAPWLDQVNCKKCGRKMVKGRGGVVKANCKFCGVQQ